MIKINHNIVQWVQEMNETMTEFKKIDASEYIGLAKARITRYNNDIEDLAREARLGRGDEDYARTLVTKDLPAGRKEAIKEMIAQDSRKGRITSPNNLGM